MNKLLVFLYLLAALASPAIAQQEDNAAGETPDVSVAVPDADESDGEEEAAADDEEDIDDSDLDIQVYEEDEDDFVPTEEIPSDEPIPFPSNI